MKFTLETDKASRIFGVVAKGVGTNKMIPVTGYVLVELRDGRLEITSTDSSNFLTYIEQGVEGTNGSCVVQADALLKLADKTTKPQMTFELKDNYLEVKGNGTYKVNLLENGEFPTYQFAGNEPPVEIESADLNRVFDVAESCISKDPNHGAVTGYYVADKCIATNGAQLCAVETAIFSEGAALISQKTADLINVMTGKIAVQKEEGKLLLASGNVLLYAAQQAGLEEYPDVSGIFEMDFDACVKFNRLELLNVLNRLIIFTDLLGNATVTLLLRGNALTIFDLKETVRETLEYAGGTTAAVEADIKVNTKFLQKLVNVLPSNEVELHFAQGGPAIKLVDGNITQFLAVIADE